MPYYIVSFLVSVLLATNIFFQTEVNSLMCYEYVDPNPKLVGSVTRSCLSCFYVDRLSQTGGGHRVIGGCGECNKEFIPNADVYKTDEELRKEYAKGRKDVNFYCRNCKIHHCNLKKVYYATTKRTTDGRHNPDDFSDSTTELTLSEPQTTQDSSTREAQTTPENIITKAGPGDGTVQMAIIIGTLAGVFLLLTIVSCLAYRRISKKCKDKPVTESSGSRQLGMLSQGDELATSTTPVSFKDCTTTSAITERSLDNARKSKSIQCYADVPTSPYSVSYGTESHSHEELVHAEDAHPDHHLQPISRDLSSPGSKHPMPRLAVQSPVAKYATSDSPVSKPLDPVLDRDATKSPVSSILREQRRSGRHQPPMSPQLVMDRLMQRGHQADESTPTTPTSTAVDPTFTSMASAMSISLYNPGKVSKKPK